MILRILLLCFVSFSLVVSKQACAQTADSTGKTLHWKLAKKDSIQPSLNDSSYPMEIPEFIGGIAAFNKYLSENIKYPDSAKKAGAHGWVLVSITVNQDGSLSNVHVKQDNVGYGCGTEALRVIQAMPKWKPARENGIPVTRVHVISVNFNLR